MARRKKRKSFPRWPIATVVTAFLLVAGMYLLPDALRPPLPDLQTVESAVQELYGYGELSPDPLLPDRSSSSSSDTLSFHVLDVGQALSVFIQAPTGECALIDAGDRDDARAVTDYLKNQGVKKLDYLIATHAHADHIGGMKDVVENIPVGQVIMSRIPDALVPTTKVYTDLLEALSTAGYKITLAHAGDIYPLGEASLQVKGPLKDYTDLNDTSVVMMLTYGSTAFLVGGDAEEEAEMDMLTARQLRPVDVLVAGHHGSATSTSQKFLDALQPRFTLISCGAENAYGHPHQETLDRLQRAGSTVLRTDVSGTLRLTSDGINIRSNTQR